MVIRRYLIVWWTLATMLALGLAAFATAAIGFQLGIVEGAVTGLVIGVVQWALLRASLERIDLWPVVTMAGWALVGLMSADWPIWAGPWIAMLQWVVLRRYTGNAGFWVIASAGGWFVTWLFTQFIQLSGLSRGLRAAFGTAVLGTNASTSLPFYLITAVNWTLGSIVYAMVTAYALALILDAGE